MCLRASRLSSTSTAKRCSVAAGAHVDRADQRSSRPARMQTTTISWLRRSRSWSSSGAWQLGGGLPAGGDPGPRCSMAGHRGLHVGWRRIAYNEPISSASAMTAGSQRCIACRHSIVVKLSSCVIRIVLMVPPPLAHSAASCWLRSRITLDGGLLQVQPRERNAELSAPHRRTRRALPECACERRKTLRHRADVRADQPRRLGPELADHEIRAGAVAAVFGARMDRRRRRAGCWRSMPSRAASACTCRAISGSVCRVRRPERLAVDGGDGLCAGVSAGERSDGVAYTNPLWTALLAWPLLGERMTLTRVVALVMAFAGLVPAVRRQRDRRRPWRNCRAWCWRCIGAIGFAFGTIYVKKYPLQLPGATAAAWQIGLGCLPVALAGHRVRAAGRVRAGRRRLGGDGLMALRPVLHRLCLLVRSARAAAGVGRRDRHHAGAGDRRHRLGGLRSASRWARPKIAALVLTIAGVALAARS